MASYNDLTTVQLKQAVQIREQIESLQAKLTALLGGSSATTKAKAGPTKGKRTLSPASRARIVAAQKARWAKLKSPVKTVEKAASKKRRSFSPETRAKLAVAMKARWAARKKGAPAPNASAK